MTTPPSLAVGDAVVLRLEDGSEQSATVTHFALKNETHRYAYFAWKTGPRVSDTQYLALHSCKWAERVVAIFPKDSKFLVVA